MPTIAIASESQHKLTAIAIAFESENKLAPPHPDITPTISFTTFFTISFTISFTRRNHVLVPLPSAGLSTSLIYSVALRPATNLNLTEQQAREYQEKA
jgi:hypothetical protein